MEVVLTLVTKDGTRKDFLLPSSATVIGRKQDCDLCIPLMNVSRKHCQINQDGGRLTVRDLDSRNGTYLNGKKIEESILSPGDKLTIGPLYFTISIKTQASGADKSAQKISSEFLKEKGVYAEAKNGNDTEIMNPISQ